MTAMQPRGWTCPNCGQGKSPHVTTCDCTPSCGVPRIKADTCPCNPRNGGSGVCGCVNPNEVFYPGSGGHIYASDCTISLTG